MSPDAQQALEELLIVQDRMTRIWSDLTGLIMGLRTTPAEDQAALQEKLDDATADLTGYAEQIKTLTERYRGVE